MLKQYIQSFRAHYYMNNPKRFKSAVRAEHTHAYQIMKKQFPSAFTCPQVVRSVVDVLEPHGYRVSDQKTRLVMSTCPDEINKILVLTHYWLESIKKIQKRVILVIIIEKSIKIEAK